MEKDNISHFHRSIVFVDGDVLFIVNGKKVVWDPSSFRPDPSDDLDPHRAYEATVYFSEENLTDGSLIMFPQKIEVEGRTYINIR